MNTPARLLATAVPLIALIGGVLAVSRPGDSTGPPPPVRRGAATAVPEAPELAPPEIGIRPAPVESRPAEASRDAESAPELSAMVAERRAERELWEELEVLPEAGESLGRSTCRAIALKRTAAYLGLSGLFEPAAAQAASEIARAWER